MAITQKGRALAWKLNPAIGSTDAIDETCSLICRLAATHNRLAEVECNVEMNDAEQAAFDRRVESLEERITRLVEDLPETDAGPFRPHFQGDPRGWTVKLLAPPPWDKRLYDGWASEAIIVRV